APKLEVSRSFVETEDGIRTQPSQGLIGKCQLGARFDAGANGGPFPHVVSNGRLSGGRLFGKKLNVPDDLTDLRLLQARSLGANERNAEQENDQQAGHAIQSSLDGDWSGLVAG